MKRSLAAATILALAVAACAESSAAPADADAGAAPVWGDREPVIYSVLVAEVVDDLGSPPAVVYVVDGICEKAGDVGPEELTCGAPIPDAGKRALAAQLERYTRVEYVDAPEAAFGGDGKVREHGLLMWLGPLEERKGGEILVGADYAREEGDGLGVNVVVEDQGGSWVVTGTAGMGSCPA